MSEWTELMELVKNSPVAQLGVFSVSVLAGWRLWKTTEKSDTVSDANASGQIAALKTWQELLASERAARIVAEQRADKFAEERNKAMEQVYDMRGQLRTMAEQVASQARELGELRLQLQTMQKVIDGHNAASPQ